MQLVYLGSTELPSRSTNAMQVMHMCAAFQYAGVKTRFLTPKNRMPEPEGYQGDLWKFYGINTRFDLVQFHTFMPPRIAKNKSISRVVRTILYHWHIRCILVKATDPIVFYGRSPLGLWLANSLRKKRQFSGLCTGVFLELHDFPSDARTQKLLKQVDGIITISHTLANQIKSELCLDNARVWVEHDGVDLSTAPQDKHEQRERISKQYDLDIDRPILVYTGRVNREKGAELILEIAEAMHGSECQFLLAGKVYNETFQSRVAQPNMSHVRLTGFIPPSQIRSFHSAADILLLPSTNELPYARYMSPLKLFEYMAVECPIIASDLPALREVLIDNINALLVPPDKPVTWVLAINRLLNDTNLYQQLAVQSRKDVDKYSWENRAKRILGYVRNAHE